MSVEGDIEVFGVEELKRKFERLDLAMQERIHDNLVEQGLVLESTVKSFAPRRTGFLESTVFSHVEGWLLRVGATAPYAYFVEFGTRFMQARKFIRRALEYCWPGIWDRLNQAVDQAIREASS
jgi:HK97 gp10 family phage protein